MTLVATPAAIERDAALDDLRTAIAGLLAAERRLRSRDHLPGDLSHAHMRSLHALADGELSAGELARSADLNPASVTAMLDHLESAGIVVRRRSTADRRVCLVALTDSGRELLAEKTARWRELWAAQLADRDTAELLAARRVVGEIAGLLDSIRLREPPASA